MIGNEEEIQFTYIKARTGRTGEDNLEVEDDHIIMGTFRIYLIQTYLSFYKWNQRKAVKYIIQENET